MANHIHEKDLEYYMEQKGFKKKKKSTKEFMGIKIGGMAKPFMHKK